MKHKLYETGDKDAPNAILDRNNEVVLSMCKICGKAEADLEEDNCISKENKELDGILMDELDYKDPLLEDPFADKYDQSAADDYLDHLHDRY